MNSSAAETSGVHHPGDGMDNLKRDRFELLSAYLDGEVSADDRRRVQDWLDHDPEVQCLYARLLKLRQELRSLPVPQAEQPVEQTVQQVFRRIERQPRRLALWGGLTIAAVLVGTFSNQLPKMQYGVANLVQPESSSVDSVSSEALMIALDRPVIEIPKAAVSNPNRQIR
jgi:anti-sigma factor RsiW